MFTSFETMFVSVLLFYSIVFYSSFSLIFFFFISFQGLAALGPRLGIPAVRDC